MLTDERPDPDQLLAQVTADERQTARGKLKVFFGASPGVGKTYAMLQAAREQQAKGVDVVVGLVETHGRSDTAMLLEGMEQLPLRAIEHRGRTLREFDLDAALSRKPQLLLVDELAHTNVPGSRHPKRYQDVEELLDVGVDVYTTVNVQHLESLNDVVGRITGARVWETVPDSVFDSANEVVLVDLPPDELLARLQAGKVYIPHQAERAMQHFFRKGNLMALRELALRRTADRVDDDVQAWRRQQSVKTIWPMRESLLVCVRPGAGSERLVRSAARLAGQLQVPWHALYVETPRLQRLPDAERARVLRTLQLAQQLGAHTANRPGDDTADVVADYAREHNLGKVLLGREQETSRWQSLWQRLRPGLAQRLLRRAPDLDVVQLATAGVDGERALPAMVGAPANTRAARLQLAYGQALLGVTGVTLLAYLLRNHLDQANIVMLFLLAVLFAAVRLGRNPAILASVLSVASFDFFFVNPIMSFSVSDVQYLLTFAVMLAVATITAHLTSGLRFQRDVAQGRERRTAALYEMARELSAAISEDQIHEIAARFAQQSFQARAVLLPLGLSDKLQAPQNPPADMALDLGLAQWTLEHAEAAGLSTDTLPSSPLLYLPLVAPMRARGVLALRPAHIPWLPTPEQQRLLQTAANLVAIALERVHYNEVAQQALLQMQSEQLRNNLLAAVSHDLRTPLTALVGLSDALELQGPPLSSAQQELVQAIRAEAQRTSSLVHNLLDMARLQSGAVTLRKEWQPVEEVVGTSLKARATALAQHQVQVDIPSDLPLVEWDAVLMERALCNLLENAAKYTPAGSHIVIRARAEGDSLRLSVCDDGPGLPLGKEKAVFDKFTRGKDESAIPGVGLGLAIVRAVVEAHQGRVWAEPRAQGGSCFVMSLPLGEAPLVPEELA